MLYDYYIRVLLNEKYVEFVGIEISFKKILLETKISTSFDLFLIESFTCVIWKSWSWHFHD